MGIVVISFSSSLIFLSSSSLQWRQHASSQLAVLIDPRTKVWGSFSIWIPGFNYFGDDFWLDEYAPELNAIVRFATGRFHPKMTYPIF